MHTVPFGRASSPTSRSTRKVRASPAICAILLAARGQTGSPLAIEGRAGPSLSAGDGLIIVFGGGATLKYSFARSGAFYAGAAGYGFPTGIWIGPTGGARAAIGSGRVRPYLQGGVMYLLESFAPEVPYGSMVDKILYYDSVAGVEYSLGEGLALTPGPGLVWRHGRPWEELPLLKLPMGIRFGR